MEEIYLTVKELADIKGCSERYIRTMVEKGKIFAKIVEVKCQGQGRGGIQYRIPLSMKRFVKCYFWLLTQ